MLNDADELMTAASQANALSQATVESIRAKGLRQLNRIGDAARLLKAAADLVDFDKEGIAPVKIADREPGTVILSEAIVAFREALKEWTRERAPLNRAAAQSNLGSALSQLGGGEDAIERLVEAELAHREALKEFTHKRTPFDWAFAHEVHLRNAYLALGKLEYSAAWLELAVKAYH